MEEIGEVLEWWNDKRAICMVTDSSMMEFKKGKIISVFWEENFSR
jgi:hypothetical protein